MVSRTEGVITFRKGKATTPTKFEETDVYVPTPDIRAESNFDPDLIPEQKMDLDPLSVGANAPDKTADQLAALNANIKSTQQKQAGLDILEGAAGALNEYFKFSQISAKAKTNIMLANYQADQALSLGKDAALREETKGFARGEQALLAAAAQGQEVSGGIARSAQLSEELYGVYNAMAIESNAIREAYGYKSQALMIKGEVDLAKIQRDLNISSSLISGATRGALGLM